MVAQVIAAPIMVVGKVATAVVKTSVSLAMKMGTAAGKAGMSAVKATGSALKTSLTNTVSTAGKMGKGLLTSVKSGPLASRFSALSNTRSALASAPSRGAVRPMAQSMSKTPVSQSVQRGADRWAARERLRMPRQSHAVENRDRAIIQRMQEAQGKQQPSSRSRFMDMARFVQERTRKALEAGKNASRTYQQANIEARRKMAEMDTGPSLER